MKIVHISTFKNGGAGTAALRLHFQLLQKGHESTFLFLHKGKETETIFKYSKKINLIELLYRVLKKLGLPPNLEQSNDYKIRRYKRKFELFSFAHTPYTKLKKHRLLQECDIIHLHFVANFIDYVSFFNVVKKPIVWTLHDMNPFQGGFHYKNDENLFSDKLDGLDEEQFAIKKKALEQLSNKTIEVVSPSKWLMGQSLHSELLGRFPHYHVPNGVDTGIFKPRNQAYCRKNLGLSQDKPIVLFVAESVSSYRKGFDRVLKLIGDKEFCGAYNFVALGSIKKREQVKGITYMGSIHDEKEMSFAYNAASVFILPSREDNLPNTMIESLCCGTPVVAFPTGGITETITNGENGFLSADHTVAGLKDALNRYMQHREAIDREAVAAMARTVFDVVVQAENYLKLYQRKLTPKNKTNLQLNSENT